MEFKVYLTKYCMESRYFSRGFYILKKFMFSLSKVNAYYYVPTWTDSNMRTLFSFHFLSFFFLSFDSKIQTNLLFNIYFGVRALILFFMGWSWQGLCTLTASYPFKFLLTVGNMAIKWNIAMDKIRLLTLGILVFFPCFPSIHRLCPF